MGRMSAYTGRALSWDWVMNASNLDLTPPHMELGDIVVGPFNLCLVHDAKAVNAAASITYDKDSSGNDLRTIDNMCSDDPTTEEVEPAGIKLSPADLDAISILCP